MTTLLEKAKSFKHYDKTKYDNPEYLELTKAWLLREINMSQIAKAITPKGKKVHSNIATTMIIQGLRKMADKGMIEFKKPK